MGHITLISIWEKVELSSLWASSALFAQRSCFSSRSVTLLDLATRPRGSLRSVERPRQSFTGVNTLQRTRLVRPPQSTTPLTPSSRRSSRFWMLLCPLLCLCLSSLWSSLWLPFCTVSSPRGTASPLDTGLLKMIILGGG